MKMLWKLILAPSEFSVPRLTLSSSIGSGIQFVSRFLSANLYAGSQPAQALIDYLLSLNHHGEVWDL